MNQDVLELSIDDLISTFGLGTATGSASMVSDTVNHDQLDFGHFRRCLRVDPVGAPSPGWE
jgi:hypothetical protein